MTGQSAKTDATAVLDDVELLDLMLADGRASSEMYAATNYWKFYEQRFVPYLREHGLTDFRRCRQKSIGGAFSAFGATDLMAFAGRIREFERLRLFNNRVMMRVPGWAKHLPSVADRVKARLLVPGYEVESYRRLCFEFTRRQGELAGAVPLEHLTVSLRGNPADVFSVGSSNYTRSILNYYLRYAYCCQFIDFSRVQLLVELGPGSGKQAEIIHKLHPHITIVLFDIPPQSYVANQYLSAVFGDDFVGYRETRSLESADSLEPGKVYLFGAFKFPIVGTLTPDLFWNASSFQEMEPPVVENYLKYVKVGTKNVYLLELLKGKERAARPGSPGVQEPLTFEHYGSYLSGFRRTDMSVPVQMDGQVRDDLRETFWIREESAEG